MLCASPFSCCCCFVCVFVLVCSLFCCAQDNPSLTSLVLDANALVDAGPQLLAAVVAATTLTQLSLDGCGLSNDASSRIQVRDA